MNIMDYVTWRGDLTFEQDSFNKIDALIFSQLSYLNFNSLISDSFEKAITISELSDLFHKSPDYDERKYMGMLINKESPVLLYRCAETQRYADCKVTGFKNILNEEKSEQFAAITFILPDNTNIIAYRGTDDTIVGWKEDFNIAHLDPIPAQTDALLYLNEVHSHLSGEKIIVGHSKGGNEAVYVSVNCGKEIQDTIRTVYNFDGPGFPKDFFKTDKFKAIEKKLFSFYPEFSVVGMIFYHHNKYEIIHSDGFAIMQHDSFTWQLKGKEFETVKSFNTNSEFFYKTFNEWTGNLTKEEICKFVTALFDVIEASGAKTNTELEENKLVASKRMLAAFHELEPETKKSVHEIIHMLVKVAQSKLFLLNLLNLAN